MARRLIICALASALCVGGFALAGTTPSGANYDVPSPGFIDAIAGTGSPGLGADGVLATSSDMLGNGEVTFDGSNGNIVFADLNNSVVRVIPATECICYGQAMSPDRVYTIAGTGTAGYSGDAGPGPSGQINHPSGVAVVPGGPYAGTVLIADTDNNVIRVVPMDNGTFFGSPYVGGDIYTFSGSLGGVAGYGGDGGIFTSAQFNSPWGAAIDNFGNLVIADTDNQRIRVIAASTGSYYGVPMSAFNIYTVAGTGVAGFSGDGHAALAARINEPKGLTVDDSNNIVFVDQVNQRVRVVASASGSFYGVSMAAGNMYTIAGNGAATYTGDAVLAKTASLSNPRSVSIDNAGNALIADQGNNRIRSVASSANGIYGESMQPGIIYTVAGNGSLGASGDGGAATAAELYAPSGVAADPFSDNFVIEDFASFELRAVASCAGGTPTPGPIELSSVSSPDTITPPQSTASQWTVTIHNPSATDATCSTINFDVDRGSLNILTGIASQGSCSFTPDDFGGKTADAVDCDLGTIAANPGNDPDLDVTVTVAIQSTGLTAPDTITGSAYFGSVAGYSTDTTQVDVVAPTPGEVEAFVPPNGSTFTDKATSPTATIIAKMKLPRKVTAGTEEPMSFSPFVTAPLVTSQGAIVVMQRVSSTSDTSLCPTPADCLGDIMHLDDFINYHDVKHPATLTLTWDPSAKGGVNGINRPLWIVKPGHDPAIVPTCAPKVSGAYTNLPCVSKRKEVLIGKKTGTIILTVLLLSGDPGFARK